MEERRMLGAGSDGGSLGCGWRGKKDSRQKGEREPAVLARRGRLDGSAGDGGSIPPRWVATAPVHGLTPLTPRSQQPKHSLPAAGRLSPGMGRHAAPVPGQRRGASGGLAGGGRGSGLGGRARARALASIFISRFQLRLLRFKDEKGGV